MRETIAAQTVILKDDVHLPEDVKVETEPYTPGWKVLKNMDTYGFDRAIRAAGWTFFSLAHTLKVSAIGGKKSNRIERGIKKLALRMRTGEFNALEIIEARPKSFLGVPYVNITARSRHIQHSMFLVLPQTALGVAADKNDIPIVSTVTTASETPVLSF
jgi:hypothetical protein